MSQAERNGKPALALNGIGCRFGDYEAVAASTLVAGGSYLVLRQQAAIWSQRLALGLALAGGLLAFAPVLG